MKTLLISFKNKYISNDLGLHNKYLAQLNQNGIYVDVVSVLHSEESFEFENCFKQNYFDAIFVCEAKLAEFSVFEALKNCGIEMTAENVVHSKQFVAILDQDESQNTQFFVAFKKEFEIYQDIIVFKSFGIEQQKIIETTNQITEKYPVCSFHTDTCGLDSKTVLVFDSKAPKVDVDKAIKEFLLTFKNNIYAEDDVSLETRLNELLKLRRLKITTAESMTGGMIAAKIVSIAGSSDVFYEGLVTYNSLAKERRLNVNHSTIVTYGVVSCEVAYEMAKGLLSNGNSETAISITGYAGATRDDSGKPEGLCFIGIGYQEAVEVYKYNFSGDRKTVIDEASNAALFLMIKTITNI